MDLKAIMGIISKHKGPKPSLSIYDEEANDHISHFIPHKYVWAWRWTVRKSETYRVCGFDHTHTLTHIRKPAHSMHFRQNPLVSERKLTQNHHHTSIVCGRLANVASNKALWGLWVTTTPPSSGSGEAINRLSVRRLYDFHPGKMVPLASIHWLYVAFKSYYSTN